MLVPLKVRRIPGGPLLANSYLIYSQEKREGILIDAVGDEVIPFLERISVRDVLLTHGHFDHVLALKKIKNLFGISYGIHEADLFLIKHFREKVERALGIEVESLPLPNIFLEDGQVINFLGNEIQVIHTPGHTPGEVCFKINNWLFTGDLLFKGSIGRTDFEGGDEEKMRESLKKILELDDKIVVFPGHGPRTTIGEERETNPFVNWIFESKWRE
jgi:glyoxylase-like metal-dependent hydrolase (beta-lactamase superfamily II)